MKKIIALAAIVLSILLITGCSITAPNYSSLSGLQSTATYTYSVSVSDVTLSSSTVTSSDTYKLTISEGSYVITISSLGDGIYTYTTDLNVSGDYEFADSDSDTKTSHPFTDKKTSTTKYAISGSSITFMETTKDVENETLCTNGRLYTFKYGYSVSYEDDDAIVTYNIDKNLEGYDNNTLSVSASEKKFSKYNSNYYIDNEMLAFFPRIFSITDSFSQSFTTIDVISQCSRTMKYSMGDTIVNSAKTVKGYNDLETVSVVPLTISIDEKFAGTGIYCYYINSTDAYKNTLDEVYTKLNDDIGYLRYKLVSIA